MTFITKEWRNRRTGATPLDAAALNDLESRIAVADGALAAAWDAWPINVKDHGAIGDGVADDTNAIIAAMVVAKATGRPLYFPAGIYLISSTLVFDHTWDKGVGLLGAGIGVSTIRRTGGTALMLDIGGSVGDQLWDVTLSGLSIDGGASSGILVDLYRANNVTFTNVEIERSFTTGLRMRKVFNSTFFNVQVHACGALAAVPAMLLDAFAETQGGCDTCMFIACQWEGNGGTDLKLTGSTGSTAPTTSITFVGIKMEAGIAADFPYIDLDYAQNVRFLGGHVYLGSARAGAGQSVLIKQGTSNSGTRANVFSGVLLDWSTQGNPGDYIVTILKGSAVFSAITMIGGADPDIAAFQVAAAVTQFRLGTDDLVTNVSRSRWIKDARGNPTVTAAASLELPAGPAGQAVLVSGSTNITQVNPTFPGDEVTLTFLGTPTVSDAAPMYLAGAFTPNGGDSLTLVCDGTNWIEKSRSMN